MQSSAATTLVPEKGAPTVSMTPMSDWGQFTLNDISTLMTCRLETMMRFSEWYVFFPTLMARTFHLTTTTTKATAATTATTQRALAWPEGMHFAHRVMRVRV